MKKPILLLKKINKDTFTKTVLGVCGFVVIFAGFMANFKSLPASNVLSSPKIPIIMYHSILDDSKRISKYVTSPETLKNDFEYLKKEGFTPILSEDLINFSKNGTPLPEKPVIITFDDGYYNNYVYAFPLLKEYNFKAVLSVVGEYSAEFSAPDAVFNNNYSHVTFDMLKEMSESGNVEIACHSYNFHNLSERKGILRKKNEDKAHYKELLIADTLKIKELISLKTGKNPVAYTYPFGAINDDAQEIIKNMGFNVTYGCEEGLNTISSDPQSLLNLKRYNRDGKLSTEEFFSKILK